eukprot:gene21072-27953_t
MKGNSSKGIADKYPSSGRRKGALDLRAQSMHEQHSRPGDSPQRGAESVYGQHSTPGGSPLRGTKV